MSCSSWRAARLRRSTRAIYVIARYTIQISPGREPPLMQFVLLKAAPLNPSGSARGEIAEPMEDFIDAGTTDKVRLF